ncbi:MAG: hypothetical protein ACRESC_01885 [Gammaproteobacteria bacterium]
MSNGKHSWSHLVTMALSALIILSVTAFVAESALLPGVEYGYRIINLGTLGGDSSAAADMNNYSQIVGWSTTDSGARHAFLYHDGMMTDLGTLQGGVNSQAVAINDRVQIVGTSEINALGAGFPEILQGFIWEHGDIQSLGALYCPCSYNVRYGSSTARGINNSSQVAGWSETVRGTWVLHALLWQSNVLQDLGGGAGDWSISRVFDINDNGQLVGDYAQDAGMLTTYDRHASLWQNDARQDLGMLPGYESSTALAINNRNQVVGWAGAFDGRASRAFRWENGYMQDLGTLPGDTNSAAQAINIFGQAVGWSGNVKQVDSHAVLWNHNRILDLNRLLPANSGWVLTEATAINTLGQIAGIGLYNGQMRAFLLQPGYKHSFPSK